MNRWEARGRALVTDRVPRIMGIVNVTPDSFSDGGQAESVEEACARAIRLADDGADLLDIGGESSRPGAAFVPLDEELRRVVPVVEALAGAVKLPLSIDTTKPEVARQALRAGACVINDISALRDPELARVAAETGAGVVLMHMPGTPQTMQLNARYDDVVREVYDFLARRVEWTEGQGIPRSRIAIDPGIGFGKTTAHNVSLVRDLARFATLGCAVVIGASRKGFLGKLTGRAISERATASVVSSLAAATRGAAVLRVHDVAPMADALKVWTALHGWEN